MIASNHWSLSEQIRYHFFLALNLHSLKRQKRNLYRFFPVMAEFVGNNRNLNQCRAHHQKRTRKQPIETILYQFYQQHYRERGIPLDHCMLQFQFILNQNQNLEQLLNTLTPTPTTPKSKGELATQMYRGLHYISTKARYRDISVQTEPPEAESEQIKRQ